MPQILLVEDDPTVRLLWEHVLIDADYDVDTAGTVAAACDCLRRRGYDLVLTDGRLADGDGMAVADTAGQKGIPSLIVTGYAFSLWAEGHDLARYKLLLKPVRPAELLTAVGRALDVADKPSQRKPESAAQAPG
ncbi:MAG: response regulator [Alphaproteobacteria bacterium]|nr:response regulator [Alphaproteobacteria bacterium]